MFELGGANILDRFQRFRRKNPHCDDRLLQPDLNRDNEEASQARHRNWTEEDFLWCWQHRGFW